MKRLFLLLLFPLLLFSSSIDLERNIYKTILYALFPSKSVIQIWCEDKDKKMVFKHIPHVKCVSKPEDADFIVVVKDTTLPKSLKGVVFATNYRILKHYKERAIGGFFWQKGRPNLMFLEANLRKKRIALPANMQKYIESEL